MGIDLGTPNIAATTTSNTSIASTAISTVAFLSNNANNVVGSGGGAPEEEEYYSSWSLFLVCVLLIISLWTSYYLQIKRIRAIHETLVSIFAGMLVGLIVRLAPGTMIKEMLTFKHTLFFNLLLPPIILNSGYELKQENFFRNFGSILTFAFLGTFVSAVGVGVLVYIYSFLGLEALNVSLLECLIFGSTLSATDPVTILAIFNQYKVDPKLYSIIFGESLLNDAVSIVMYETLSQFHGTEIYIQSIFHGIGIFLLSFSVSMVLGVSFGLGMSLLLKHSYLHQYPNIESCLVALCAYTCYFFSNGLSMSGIVSLLFCGITLKHYAYHTMSRRTQRATKYVFSTLAQLSENFIFIYLGLSLFTSAPISEPVFSYVKPVFIVITLVAVVFTRYAAVFPLSEAINMFHRYVRGQRTEELPHAYQMMLFWAGLRGAVGVALAAGFKGPNAQILRTTVLVVVVLTVLIFGGTTARMLEVLKIRTGVEDDGASSDEDGEVPYGFSTRGHGSGSGRASASASRWGRYTDEDSDRELGGGGALGSLYPATRFGAGGRARGTHTPHHHHHHHHRNGSNIGIFSGSSSESFDSDGGEVLPMAPTSLDSFAPQHQQQHQQFKHPRDNRVFENDNAGAGFVVNITSPLSSMSPSPAPPGELHPNLLNPHFAATATATTAVATATTMTTATTTAAAASSVPVDESNWFRFQTLDERYLLPLFSNATASRTFHARKASRKKGRGGGGGTHSRSGSEYDGMGGSSGPVGVGVGGSGVNSGIGSGGGGGGGGGGEGGAANPHVFGMGVVDALEVDYGSSAGGASDVVGSGYSSARGRGGGGSGGEERPGMGRRQGSGREIEIDLMSRLQQQQQQQQQS